MEKWLLTNVPTFWLGLLIAVVAVATAIGGFVVVRRTLEHEKLVSQHDVAGFLIAVVGVIYAVLLAFMVVIQWEQYSAAAGTAATEAGAIGNLYRDAVALGPAGNRLRVAVDGYARELVYVEWPYVAGHLEEDPQTDSALNGIWKAVTLLKPSSAASSELVRRTVDDISTANTSRRERVEQSSTQLPTVLWVVLIVGGGLTIGFCYFFSLENFRSQAAMIAILASLIGLSLFLILVLDLPFTGDVAVAPSALQDEISEFCSYNFVQPRQAGNCNRLGIPRVSTPTTSTPTRSTASP